MDEKFVDAMLGTIVMFQKGYKTFKTENKNLSEEEVIALTDVWWRGLMYSVVAANTKNNDDTEGIHGLDN